MINQKQNVPNLRFVGYTDEWALNELQKVATISKGSGISKDQLSKNGTYCILYGELYTKYNSEIISEVYSKTEVDAANLVKSKENDVIIPCSGETAIDISTARCVPFNGILLGGDLNIIRLKNQNGGFFAYQLNGKRKVDIAKVAQGVSVVHLYGEHLKRVKIAYPTYSEQKKIADFLSLLDSRIATQNKIIEQLQSLIKGICNKLLYADNGKLVKLGDILIERKEKSIINNQYEILSSTVKGVFSQRDYFSKDIASENNIGYKIIRLNDIVLSPQNLWMGNINFNNKYEIGIVSPSYKIFAIKEDFNKIYIANLLKTHRALYNYMQVSEQGASIVRRNLNLEAFEQLSFKIPDYQEQCRIARILISTRQKIQLETSLLNKYEEQKKFLLSNMFI